MKRANISNFYIPEISSEIKLSDQDLKSDYNWKDEESMEDVTSEIQVFPGIADFWKQNSIYKELWEITGVYVLDNKTLIELITECFEYLVKKNSKQFNIEEDNKHQIETPQLMNEISNNVKVDVIMMWRFKRYSIKSISAKSWLPREQVNNIISKYRSIVKRLSKKKRNLRKGTRLAVTINQISKIKAFWDKTKDKPIKIRDVKLAVWPPGWIEKTPSNSTISSILKKELRMKYKVLQFRNLKTETFANKRLFIENLAIQGILKRNNTELIYIDEFSFSSRK